MRRDTGISTKSGGVDHQKWCAFLRRRHPVKTAAFVAAELGAPVRTVENWLSGAATPHLGWFLKAVQAYGPEMLEAVLADPPAWLIEARRRAQREDLERRLAALDATDD